MGLAGAAAAAAEAPVLFAEAPAEAGALALTDASETGMCFGI